MSAEQRLFVEDSWLTGILERPVFRLNLRDSAHELLGLENSLCAELERLASRSFVYVRIETESTPILSLLVRLGFSPLETALVFDKPRSTGAAIATKGIRFALPSDVEWAPSVAAACFTKSRFHVDPSIGQRYADRVKFEWVRNFFLGQRGQYMAVSEMHGRGVGFLQLLASNDQLVIDLIGVAPEAQGRGVGAAMIQFAERELSQFATLRVGTQLSNIQSIRLYEKLGFRVCESAHVLHFHKGS